VFKKTLIFLFYFFVLNQANANGVSPYLPLNTDPLIELHIERLASITQMPILSKPYHIVTVVKYLEKVRTSHPTLYNRLNNYIKRFKHQSAITHFSTSISHSNKEIGSIDNQRGIAIDSSFQTSIAGFHQFNKYAIANFGGALVDKAKIIPHNTYFSFGYEYLQVDLGYREHWLSPLQESALALSTNAKPTASITMSNVKPITNWNVKYEMSFSLLDEMEGIHFDDTTSSGQPGFLTMQLSLQPFSWWTIGGVRTFMFAGGNRKIDLRTIGKAIIDPISGDNCGGESSLQDCDLESGNQIASITSKFDFSINAFPISLLLEYAGEDAKDYKYSLGNIARTYGIFLPYLTEKTSLYAEFTEFHDRWYVHHLYDEGYRNDGTVMGHWWGNNKALSDISAGNASTIRFNWDVNNTYHIQFKLRSAFIEPSEGFQYQRTNDLEVKLKQVYQKGFLNYSINLGKDIQNESYYKIAFGYNW
jgi:hypothetical protein